MTAETASSPGVIVRHCHGLVEFEACLALQRTVWAGADIDVVPLPLFVVAAETGGEVLGAYLGDQLVGFTMALAGLHGSQPFLHSHMTAVLPEYRDRGVGRQLKLFQRQDALSRGIELVEWTFDPLETKNAYFNLMRLGAIARRYLPNCYGITTSSLHCNMPTDRLVAEWWLRSARTESIIAGQKPAAPREALRIRVPANIDDLRRSNPSEAIRVQSEVRRQFFDAFSRKLSAVALEVTPSGADYVLNSYYPS
jgi:predicted GNAT superfamily acetyltransferase